MKEGCYERAACIRKSAAIQRRVGEMQRVRLGILDDYRQSLVGPDRWVKMTLHVVGSTGSVRVKIRSSKANGIWTVTDASIDGEPINLN